MFSAFTEIFIYYFCNPPILFILHVIQPLHWIHFTVNLLCNWTSAGGRHSSFAEYIFHCTELCRYSSVDIASLAIGSGDPIKLYWLRPRNWASYILECRRFSPPLNPSSLCRLHQPLSTFRITDMLILICQYLCDFNLANSICVLLINYRNEIRRILIYSRNCTLWFVKKKFIAVLIYKNWQLYWSNWNWTN